MSNNLGQGALGDDRRVTCLIASGETLSAGAAVSLSSGTKQREVKAYVAADGFYGIVFDINTAQESCVVTVQGSAITALGTATTATGQGLLDTNGVFASTGTATNATVTATGVTGVNGNTGEKVADCVLVDVGYARTAAPETATVAETATKTKKGA